MLGERELLEGARRVNERHVELHRASKETRPRGPRPLSQQELRRRAQAQEVHKASARELWVAFDEFYDPLWDLPERMATGDLEAVEAGIIYLEVSPRCFRSGYLAERVMRHLSRAELTPDQHARCIEIVMNERTHKATRLWRYIGALAGSVWSEALQERLNAVASSGEWATDEVRMLMVVARSWRGNRGLTTDTSTLDAELLRKPERWRRWWERPL